MSASLFVNGHRPVVISTIALTRKFNEVVDFLLHQDGEQKFELDLFRDSVPVESLIPDDKLYSFMEKTQMRFGGYIVYDLHEHWREYGEAPFYQFSIPISRRVNLDSLACVALAISAAHFLWQDSILDYSGLLGHHPGIDAVPTKALLHHALSEKYPLDEAIERFFDGLRPFRWA